MYNETIHFIKNNTSIKLDWHKIRTKYLKSIKKRIITKSKTIITVTNKNAKKMVSFGKNNVMAHIMDGAIRLACANYQSAYSNFRNGHIKHFRIRYWRKDKPTKIMDIEPCYFYDTTFCPSVFKAMETEKVYNNGKIFEFKDIKEIYGTECKLQFDSITNRYTLFVPTKFQTNPKNNDNVIQDNIISLDPGIRTFMTGLSHNTVCKIGTDMNEYIKDKFLRLDIIKANPNIPNKVKKKCERIINRKVKFKVDELHWKTINYLTNNY